MNYKAAKNIVVSVQNSKV